MDGLVQTLTEYDEEMAVYGEENECEVCYFPPEFCTCFLRQTEAGRQPPAKVEAPLWTQEEMHGLRSLSKNGKHRMPKKRGISCRFR